jgi:hypothetical protein
MEKSNPKALPGISYNQDWLYSIHKAVTYE